MTTIELASGLGMKSIRITPIKDGVQIQCLYKPAFTERVSWGNNASVAEVRAIIAALQQAIGPAVL